MSVKPYAVVRATTIDAAPDDVRAHLEDLTGWRAWSPWPPLAEGTDVVVTGGGRAVGSRIAWTDDPRIGTGYLEVADSQETIVVVDMESERPRSSGNVMVFLLSPVEEGTRVTWTMHGEVVGWRRFATWLWPMGKSIGPGFSKGLARLKALVEGDNT